MAKLEESDRGESSAPSGARGRGARVLTERQLAPYDRHLGMLPDGRVAEMAGLSTATVGRIRRSRGIAPAPRAQQPQVTGATDAYRVTTRRGDRWVVLASNLLEASEGSAARGLDAVEIEWVGALIR